MQVVYRNAETFSALTALIIPSPRKYIWHTGKHKIMEAEIKKCREIKVR